MTLTSGIHPSVAEADYHSAEVTDEPSLSASIAKILLTRSPLHAFHAHPKLNPSYEATHSDKFDLGTAAHDLFLRGLDNMAVAPFDSWRSKDAQAHREAARAAGLIPLLEKDEQRVREMVGAIRDQLAARDDEPPLFAAGKPEQTLVWRDKPTGVLCRARLDWLHDSFLAADDLKTVPSKGGSANPHDWQRTFWGIGADVEARFHSRGVKTLTGSEPHFRFVVAEANAPYAISVVDLAPSAIELADQKINRALAIWKDCLDRDQWPGYPGVASIEVNWQAADFIARHWEPEEEEVAA